jgi:hypothetical protein
MKKVFKYLAVFSFSFLACTCFSQNNPTDSLLYILKTSKIDTIKIIALNAITLKFWKVDLL